MNVVYQENKFAFRRISDKKWLNIWCPTIYPKDTRYSLIDNFYPSICIFNKYTAQQDFIHTKLDLADYELITISITYNTL